MKSNLFPKLLMRDKIGQASKLPNNSSAVPRTNNPDKEPEIKSRSLRSLSSLKSLSKETKCKTLKEIRAAVIMDEFTFACFEPECILDPIEPDTWRHSFERNRPDLFFVESTWWGNGKKWINQNRVHLLPKESELHNVLSYCKENAIPTVFWNKEDPFGFKYFLDAAKLFDYIYTTDENSIPDYLKVCGHANVFALPFAAQPAIHNPFLTARRENSICFAGTYYNNMFEDRRRQLDIVLDSAKDFEFVIYNRQQGYNGPEKENYYFPERFQKFIKGALGYKQMLAAYKKHKIFLNVNTIVNSKTMFARRVYELMASGTPVVSTAAAGIEAIFPELVPQIENSEEGRAILSKLLNDTDFWRNLSASGVRAILKEHTYEKRLRKILADLGIAVSPAKEPDITLVVKGTDKQGGVFDLVNSQTVRPVEVIFLEENSGALRKLKNAGFSARCMDGQNLYNHLRKKNRNHIIAFWEAGDYYGAEYLFDAVNALACSPFDISGMSAVCGQENNSPKISGQLQDECLLGSSFYAATVVLRKKFFFNKNVFDKIINGEQINIPSVPGFGRPAFEYAKLDGEKITRETLGKVSLSVGVKKRNLLFSGHDFKFLTPFIEHCKESGKYNIKIAEDKGHDLTSETEAAEFVRWADVVFCEWALGNAVWYSEHKRAGQLLVVRLHSQEIESPKLTYLQKINWNAVDSLITICPQNYERMKSRYPSLDGRDRMIYNPIDTRLLSARSRMDASRFTVGFVGIVPKRKRFDLAFEIFEKLKEKDSRYNFRIKGRVPSEYEWMRNRREEMQWYDEIFQKIEKSKHKNSVFFDSHGSDMPEWYSRIGFLLSTSDFEGSHQAVAEAMASGAIPIIRPWLGAKEIYTEDYLYRDTDDAVEKILALSSDTAVFQNISKKCREYASTNFEQTKICAKMEDLFSPAFPASGKTDKSVKMLLVAYLVPNKTNGYRIRVEQMLRELKKTGVDARLLILHPALEENGLSELRDSFGKEGIIPHLLPCASIFNQNVDEATFTQTLDGMDKILRGENIPIVQFEALYCARVGLLLKKKNPRFKIIFDCHGISPEEEEMAGADASRVRVLAEWEKYVLKNADLSILVSEAMYSHFVQKYGGVNRHVTLPCCLSGSNMTAKSIPPEKYNLSGDSLVIGYVGTLAAWQCADEMFSLFAALWEKEKNIIFFLIAPSGDHGRAKESFQKQGISPENFRIVELPHEEVVSAAKLFDIGVLLRRSSPVNKVASPTKFGEYLAAGVPVVLTDCIGDYSQAAKDKKLGVVLSADLLEKQEFPPSAIDAILALACERKSNRAIFEQQTFSFISDNLLWENRIKQLVVTLQTLPESNVMEPVVASVFEIPKDGNAHVKQTTEGKTPSPPQPTFRCVLKQEGNFLIAEIIHDLTDPKLEYAFYLFCNGDRVESIWYSQKKKVTFKSVLSPGYYWANGFMRNDKTPPLQQKSNSMSCNISVLNLGDFARESENLRVAQVHVGNWDFTFMHFPRPEKRLFVCLTAAITDRKSIPVPNFQRWTWAKEGFFPGNVLCVSDPTLEKCDELKTGFYFGTKENNACAELIELVSAYARHKNISNNKVIFWGSSVGGFSALACAALLPGSTAMAVNPQTNVFQYEATSKEFYSFCLDGAKESDLSEEVMARLDMKKVWSRESPSRAIIVINTLDTYHYRDHFTPFWKQLGGTFDMGWNFARKHRAWIYSDIKGHGPETQEMGKQILISLFETQVFLEIKDGKFAAEIFSPDDIGETEAYAFHLFKDGRRVEAERLVKKEKHVFQFSPLPAGEYHVQGFLKAETGRVKHGISNSVRVSPRPSDAPVSPVV